MDDDPLAMSDEQLLALPRPPCPQSGSRGGLIPRIYGLPSPDDDLFRLAEAGEVDVEFAGCVIPFDPLPVWRCRRCDALVAREGGLIERRRVVSDAIGPAVGPATQA